MSEMIRVENVSYIYNEGMPDETTALNNINISVNEGEFVGLIGPTGCGKSTLITHFNGINKPGSGKIYIGGEDIWHNPKNIRKFRFMVGLVFQYPEYQLFEETVYKDIAYGPINMGLTQQEVKQRVEMAAHFCQLSNEMLQKSPFELSGGQKRRAAIAGVLAMQPKILVLDEPAAGLDPMGRDAILGQIKDYHKQTKNTTILVSHSMEDIAKYADKVIVMNNAQVIMYDTTQNVFANAQMLINIGLSVPQITQIFLKLKQMGLNIKTDVYTMDYAVKTILNAKNSKDIFAEKGGV